MDRNRGWIPKDDDSGKISKGRSGRGGRDDVDKSRNKTPNRRRNNASPDPIARFGPRDTRDSRDSEIIRKLHEDVDRLKLDMDSTLRKFSVVDKEIIKAEEIGSRNVRSWDAVRKEVDILSEKVTKLDTRLDNTNRSFTIEYTKLREQYVSAMREMQDFNKSVNSLLSLREDVEMLKSILSDNQEGQTQLLRKLFADCRTAMDNMSRDIGILMNERQRMPLPDIAQGSSTENRPDDVQQTKSMDTKDQAIAPSEDIAEKDEDAMQEDGNELDSGLSIQRRKKTHPMYHWNGINDALCYFTRTEPTKRTDGVIPDDDVTNIKVQD